MTRISISLPDTTIERLEKVRHKTGVNISAQIRAALETQEDVKYDSLIELANQAADKRNGH